VACYFLTHSVVSFVSKDTRSCSLVGYKFVLNTHTMLCCTWTFRVVSRTSEPMQKCYWSISFNRSSK